MSLALTAVSADELATGRRIYQDGTGRDTISARQRELEIAVDARQYPCVRCHGADGRGTREGGITAPPLTVIGDTNPAQIAAWLASAFSGTSGTDARKLNPAMPSYVLSERDRLALAAYIRTLPYGAEPGLTTQLIRLGVNLDGSGLDTEGVATVFALLDHEAEAVNRQGGIFGRRIAIIENNPETALITLAWAADIGAIGRWFGIRPSAKQSVVAPCGTLHPPLAAQVDWLSGKLAKEKRNFRIWNPDTPDSKPDQEIGEQAIIYLGEDANLETSLAKTTGSFYVFHDLIERKSLADYEPRITLVLPLDFDGQIRRVAQLKNTHPTMAADPRTASIALEMVHGLEMVVAGLKQQGRRVTALELCQHIEALAQKSWHFTLLPTGDIAPQP